jgi:iron complex outermembrane receptor protein
MLQHRLTRRACLMGSAAVVALCGGAIADAQTTPAVPAESAPAAQSPAPEAVTDESQAVPGGGVPAQAADEIVVTGSRIRGIAPVGSSVIAVGREDIGQTSAVSTSEIFRNIPQIQNIGVQESNRGVQGGAGNITYASGANIRGISPFATLTLINGHRVVGAGTQGLFVDPSVIPITALERVEVLADGSSAIYGSDAVAGVVNLILRRNLDGIEVNARYGVAENYFTRQLGAAVGKVWDTGQIMLTGEYSFHPSLNGLERDYVRSDQRNRGGPDLRVTNCNPGTLVSGGVNYAIPVGGVTAANRNALIPGTINRCDIGAYSDIIPEIKKVGAVLTFRQELGPAVTISGDGFYYKRTFLRQATVPAQALTIRNTNPYFVAPPGTNPASVVVNYFFGNDLGNTLGFNGSSESYMGTVGADVKLSDRWSLDLGVTAGNNKDIALNYGPNPTALTAALNSTNPATAFNAFGGPNNPAVIASLGNYVTLGAPGSNDLLQVQGSVSGALFTLPGGDVRIAIGAEYNKTKVDAGNRTGPIGSLTGQDFHFSRNVKSAYAELVVPLFGADNETAGFHRLLLNVAGRYDKYNDVGDTWNPKAGLEWEPARGFKLRGNWGTSFRAPPLTNLISINPSITSLSLQDPKSPTGFTVAYSQNEGNIDLVPEEATTWSVGVDLTPASLPGASLTASYFNVEYTGQITSLLGDLTVLQREALYPGLIIRNPSIDVLNALRARLPARGVIADPATVGVLIDSRSNNLGVTKVDGIDFLANYRFETENAGTFGMGINGIWYSHYKVAQSANAPLIERIGFINYPVKYNLRANANWRKDAFSATVFVNHVPSYRNNSIAPEQRIKKWTTVDLNLAVDIPQGDNNWYKGATFSINVQNLFDRDPPYAALAPTVNQSGGYDVQQSNPLGRLITAGVSLKF